MKCGNDGRTQWCWTAVRQCIVVKGKKTYLYRVEIEDMCSTAVIGCRQPLAVRTNRHSRDRSDQQFGIWPLVIRRLARILSSVFHLNVLDLNALGSFPPSHHPIAYHDVSHAMVFKLA